MVVLLVWCACACGKACCSLRGGAGTVGKGEFARREGARNVVLAAEALACASENEDPELLGRMRVSGLCGVATFHVCGVAIVHRVSDVAMLMTWRWCGWLTQCGVGTQTKLKRLRPRYDAESAVQVMHDIDIDSKLPSRHPEPNSSPTRMISNC